MMSAVAVSRPRAACDTNERLINEAGFVVSRACEERRAITNLCQSNHKQLAGVSAVGLMTGRCKVALHTKSLLEPRLDFHKRGYEANLKDRYYNCRYPTGKLINDSADNQEHSLI